MAKFKASEETRFARGDIGVDGGATDEAKDEAEVEKEKAREQFLRGKAYLGREFLTWLLYRSESGEPLFEHEGLPVVLLLSDRLLLRGITGEIVELSARGAMAPYARLIREALDKGLLVHQCRLRLSHGERVYQVTVDAEHFDCKSAKLPALLSEEEDDKLEERLHLADELGRMIDRMLEGFLRLRASKSWQGEVVPAMKAWMAEASE